MIMIVINSICWCLSPKGVKVQVNAISVNHSDATNEQHKHFPKNAVAAINKAQQIWNGRALKAPEMQLQQKGIQQPPTFCKQKKDPKHFFKNFCSEKNNSTKNI